MKKKQVTPPSNRSRAEKRALWEVRERYNINKQGKTPSFRKRQIAEPGAKSTTPPPPPTKKTSRRQGAPRKGKWLKRIFLALILIILLSGGIFGYKIIAASNKISVAERSLLGQLKDLLFAQGKELGGETNGRINILLIAIGGEGHKGKNLADTIMIASIDSEKKSVALLSIPRDLYVKVPGEEYYTKINAVHAYGESRKKDDGPELLKEKIEEITNLPIHYYARVDFTAFKHIVDAVGGINITIDNSFFDYWHKISFPAGTEKMNGERALAFVRARYIEGPEGGDFKRAARQQQILLALREKVFSFQTAIDFGSLNSILDSLADNIRTDMHLWEMKRFFELARNINHENVSSVVLTTGPKGVLVGGTEILGGVPASVLRPRTGDFSEIQDIAQNIFNVDNQIAGNSSSNTPEEIKPEEIVVEEEEIELPAIEVRNGTNVTGLAKSTADKLESDGYPITDIGNAEDRSTPSTTIYNLNTDFIDQSKALADKQGWLSDSGLPQNEPATEADILIILGADEE